MQNSRETGGRSISPGRQDETELRDHHGDRTTPQEVRKEQSGMREIYLTLPRNNISSSARANLQIGVSNKIKR